MPRTRSSTARAWAVQALIGVVAIACFGIFIQLRAVGLIRGGRQLVADATDELLDYGLWCSLRHGPIRQQVGERAILISWETNCPASVTDSAIESGVLLWTLDSDEVGAGGGSTAAADEARARFVTANVRVGQAAKEEHGHGAAHFVHSVLLKDLDVGEYVYALRGKFEGASRPWKYGQFPLKVLPPHDPQASVRLVLVGDSQPYEVQDAAHVRWLQILRLAKAREPDYFVHVGDVVQASSERSWDRFFFQALDSTGITPAATVVLARGNHDDAAMYRERIGAGSQPWFSFSFGTARVIVLDSAINPSEQFEKDQLAFLKAETESQHWRGASFRIAIWHVAPFIEYWRASKWEKESKWASYVRTDWVPWLRDNDVDLIICGHSHIYQRGSEGDTTFAIIGGAGGQLERESERVDNHDMYAVTKFNHHYVVLDLKPAPRPSQQPTLEWTAYSAADQVIDSVMLEGHEFSVECSGDDEVPATKPT